MKKSAPYKPLIVILGFFLVFACIVAGVFYYFFPPGEPPIVDILRPDPYGNIRSGQGLFVVAESYGEGGLERVEFLINGEVDQVHRPLEDGTTSFRTVFSWFGNRIGRYSLSVVAYDLRGRPSEVQTVTVDVLSRETPVVDGIASNSPDNDPGASIENGAAGEGGPVEGGAEGAAEAGGQGEAPEAEGEGAEGAGEVGGQGDGAEGAEGAGADAPAGGDGQAGDQGAQEPVLGDPPIAPNDDIPSIISFDFDLDLVDNNIVANVIAVAEDDVGLVQIDFRVQAQDGDSNGFTVLCGGEQRCETDGAFVLTPGEYILGAIAIDTSGQASEEELQFAEVIDQEGLPPAAADHEEDWEDWFRDRFANIVFEIPGSFDLDDWLENIFGNFEWNPFGQPAEPPPAQEVQGNCITLSAEPVADGMMVHVEITCEANADAGNILYLAVSKGAAAPSTTSVHVQDWYDENRTRLTAGESFDWLDRDAICGSTAFYRVRIANALVRTPGQNNANASQMVNILDGAEGFFHNAACPRGSIGDIGLRVEQIAVNGVEVSWAFPEGAAWPEDLPDEGVTVELYRWNELTDEDDLLRSAVIPRADLGGRLAWVVGDLELVCGTPYWYRVQVLGVGEEVPWQLYGWLVNQSVRTEGIPCPQGSIGSIEIHAVQQPYVPTSTRVLVEASIPANFSWPQGNQITVKLERWLVGENACSPPCDGLFHVVQQIPITPQMRGQPITIEQDDAQVRCGDNTYQYRLVLNVDGENVEYGQNYGVTMRPCPPGPPTLQVVWATSRSNCPNNAPLCVRLEWDPYVQPLNEDQNNPAVMLIIERTQSCCNGSNSYIFEVPIDQTSWVDISPTTIIPRQNPNAPSCAVPRGYRIYAVDAEGHWHGASPLQLPNLPCNGPWDARVERR